MPNTLHHQLLHLLRCALWQQRPDKRLFGNDTDWEALMALARQHTVQAMVAQQMKRVADALGNETVMKRCTRQILAATRRNRHINQLTAKLDSILRQEGYQPVLLKGQGVARYYPEPLLRMSGDIDLYLGPHTDKAVDTLCRQLHIETHHGRNDRKHVNMTCQDVEMGVHRKETEVNTMARAQEIQDWTEEQLHTDTRQARIDGCPLTVPSPLFDAIYVFHHLYRHLLTDGVGLRHVCDWMRCLYANRDDIDTRQLLQLLQRFGLLHAWQLFGLMTVRHLGMTQEAMPLYRERYAHRADRLIEVLLDNSNFGQERLRQERTQKPAHRWAAKLYSIHCYNKAHWPLVTLFPRQAIPLMLRRYHKAPRTNN